MSTSRDSRIGLPPSSDSTIASSRARSWISRAIRKTYLPRSSAGSFCQRGSASRAAATAASTSAAEACAISVSGSSVAGLMVGS